jgi:hypothetical protein
MTMGFAQRRSGIFGGIGHAGQVEQRREQVRLSGCHDGPR